MSCPGDTSVTNKPSTIYNSSQYNSNLTQQDPFYIQNPCRKILRTYPSFTPTILSLSTTSSANGVYSVVYINGSNFLPPCIGTTYVNFGVYKNLPVIFFSSGYISFTVPLNAPIDNYSVVVVNVYNGNFSPQVNISSSGVLNYSNSITYTIT
jgi:hypothetical protein